MPRLLFTALMLSLPAVAGAQVMSVPLGGAKQQRPTQADQQQSAKATQEELARAQQVPGLTADTGQPPRKVRDIALSPGQACPKAQSDEIVVCRPLEDPYRIPKALRRPVEIPAQNQSWVNRAATIDQVGRVAGGLPDTCSPVGNGGQTGCALQANQQWAAEKRQQLREQESIP